jgi:hypothetical protein
VIEESKFENMDEVFEFRGWKSYFLWEGLPFLLPMFAFGLISALNWPYESKLISLDKNASDWTGAHLGPILLASATGGVAAAFSLSSASSSASPNLNRVARGTCFFH